MDGRVAGRVEGVPDSFAPGDTADAPRIRLGRDADNDIVLMDLLVSRHHAEVRRREGGALEIVDLASRNGTFVNGRQITTAGLSDRDLVTIGLTSFVVTDGNFVRYDSASGAMAFEATGLSIPGTGERLLVDDVGFCLPERSLCAIVGPSGSGKSTLLQALAGLRPAPVGSVCFEGQDLYRNYAALRSHIGYVPQADVLHRELPLRQALDYAGRLRFPAEVTAAERAQRVDEVLDELGLSHRGHLPIHLLSGGEQKRTSVALELLTKPSLLFLDEPASGLDPGLARMLMRLLRELAYGGRTIVVVTHELDNLETCDQVVVLAPGGVPAYIGPPESAADAFGRDDLIDVFSDFVAEPERDWRSPTHAHAAAAQAASRNTPDLPSPSRRQGWLAQVRALTARYVKVLMADRRNAALLALQAPLLGVLMLAALPAGELGVPADPEVRLVSTAGLVLFVVLLGGTWIGANNAVREIARELPILRRERSVGLSLSAYVTSKVVVLAGMTILQSAVLVAIATARQRGPTDAVVLGWGTGELMVVVAGAGVASMAVALLVSAAAGSPERATSILPMLLILHLVLSAGVVLPEIADKPVLREIGLLSSAQWGVSAAASTADLNELQLFDQRLRDLRVIDAGDPTPAVEALTSESTTEGRWDHTPGAWLIAMGALSAITIAALCGAALVLRRLDPGR